jgi:hypothetical protein
MFKHQIYFIKALLKGKMGLSQQGFSRLFENRNDCFEIYYLYPCNQRFFVA